MDDLAIDLLDINDMEDLEDLLEINNYTHRIPRYRLRMNPFIEYGDDDFKAKYRFSKRFALKIVDLVKDDLSKSRQGGSVCPQIQVASALRCWARHEIQDDTADLHGISQQMVSKLCKNVAIALAKIACRYISMPTTLLEEECIMREFRSIAGFPSIIGAIDCTHIKIKRVGGDASEAYVNRKGYFSLNVQVICDSNLKIRDIVARWRGSAHDSRIFNESRIKEKFEAGEFHGRLLGDSGYACTSYLFTPILNPSNLRQERYNRAHIRTRNTVERCFGVWKQRFRCLLRGLYVKLSTVKTTIVALAVLHNIAIQMKEELIEETEIIEIEETEIIENQSLPLLSPINQHSLRGNVVRNRFIEENF